MSSRIQSALAGVADGIEAEFATVDRLLADVQTALEGAAALPALNGLRSFCRQKAREIELTRSAIGDEAAKKAAEYRGQAPRAALAEDEGDGSGCPTVTEIRIATEETA